MRIRPFVILHGLAVALAFVLVWAGEAPAAKSAVRIEGGVPWLFVDARPVTSGFYEVYYYPGRGRPIPNQPEYRDPRWIEAMRRVVDTAVRQKIRVVMASIWWSDLDNSDVRPSDPGKGLDFAPFDAFMRYARERGVLVVIKTSVNHFLPKWWLRENGFPVETGYQEQSLCALCETDAYGTAYSNPSMGSEAVRRDYTAVITALVTRYRRDPALIGWAFGLGPTGEDPYGPDYIVVDAPGGGHGLGRKPMMFTDYSPDFTARFRDWLTRKYGTDEALRRAWNDPTVSLANFRTPPPAELVRDPAAFTREPFPDPAIGREIDPVAVLTSKGLDFYAFRVVTRESDTDYYARLFKKLDPDHVLLLNARARPSARANPAIDGIFFNPHPRFGQPMFHDANQFYTILSSVTAIVREGKLAWVAAENSPERTPVGGRWETPQQLNYVTSLGYSVKALGGVMGYAVDLLDPETDNRWLPTWFSGDALAAERAIEGYRPVPGDQACGPIRALREKNQCGEGQSHPLGCGLIELAYLNYCHTGLECDKNGDGVISPSEFAACRAGSAPAASGASGMPAQTSPSGQPALSPPSGGMAGKCGDGICDDFERQHGVCPQDCGASSGQGTTQRSSGGIAPGRSSALKLGSGGPAPTGKASGKCGDGICDDFERQRGVCPQDCGASSGQGSSASTPSQSGTPAMPSGQPGAPATTPSQSGTTSTSATPASSTPQATQPPAGQAAGKCGDGICDDFERQHGVCPQDCGTSSGQKAPATP